MINRNGGSNLQMRSVTVDMSNDFSGMNWDASQLKILDHKILQYTDWACYNNWVVLSLKWSSLMVHIIDIAIWGATDMVFQLFYMDTNIFEWIFIFRSNKEGVSHFVKHFIFKLISASPYKGINVSYCNFLQLTLFIPIEKSFIVCWYFQTKLSKDILYTKIPSPRSIS